MKNYNLPRSIYLSYLPTYLSIYLYIYISLSLSISLYLSISLSIYLFFFLSFYLPTYLSNPIQSNPTQANPIQSNPIYLSNPFFLINVSNLSIYLFYLSNLSFPILSFPIHLFIYLSIYLSIYISIYLSIFWCWYIYIYKYMYVLRIIEVHILVPWGISMKYDIPVSKVKSLWWSLNIISLWYGGYAICTLTFQWFSNYSHYPILYIIW